MPSSKRSKEETWKEDELAKSLKAARSGSKSKEKESSNPRDKEKSRHQNKDDKRSSTRSDRKERKEESRSHSEKENRGGRNHRSSSLSKDERENRKRKEEGSRDHKTSSDKKRDGERSSDGRRNHERASEIKKDSDRVTDRKESRDLEKSKERREGRSRVKEKDQERRNEHEGDKEHRRGRDRDREDHRSSGDKERGHRSSGDKERSHRSSEDNERGHRSSGDKERGHRRESRQGRSEDRGEKERSKESRTRHKEKRDDHFRGEEIRDHEKHERRRDKEGESSKRDRKGRERKEKEEDRRKDKGEEQRAKSDREKRDNDDRETSHRRKHDGRDGRDNDERKSFLKETEISGGDSFPSTTKDQLHDNKDVDDQEDDFDYEDEEFEDYDDDFEDDMEEALGNGTNSEGSENEQTEIDAVEDKPPLITLTPSEKMGIEWIKLAINAENERARSASQSPSRPSTSEGDTSFSRGRDLLDSSPKPSQSFTLKGRINFVAAKAMQVSKSAAMKSKQRGQELLKLLELDPVSIHLFELVPTNEYELYMKNFGVADSTQVSTQACQEGYDVDTQTEEIESQSKWCQHSSEVQASGAGEDVDKKFYQISTSANATAITTDTVRLNNFLLKASQVCLTLLNERASDIQKNAVEYQETKTNFSESFVELGTSSLLLQGRELKSVSPPSFDVGLFLTAYGPSHFTKESPDLALKGLICVWKPSEPGAPQRFLICESIPLCCCFSTPRASFVFAGMDDGSLLMYDLSESPAFHMKRRMRKEKHVLYSATFSTASVLVAENHQGPIVSLAVLSQQQERMEPKETVSISGKRDGAGMSFQIATLDDLGVVNIWIVVEVQRPDPGGSEVDLGLSPGGKWKLSKTGSLAMGIKQRTLEPGKEICRALSCNVCLNNPNHFYIGTDKGQVVHLARFGERASPRVYKSALESSNTVTTMDISPWNVGCFLVGYDDGILRLYSFQNELPLMEWPTATAGAPYSSVKWSRCKASAFFTLDVNNVLAGWNLLSRDDAPIWQEKLGQGQRNLSHFTLLGGSYPTEEKETVETPEMVLFYDNGSIESHRLSQSLIQSEAQEVQRFRAFLENT